MLTDNRKWERGLAAANICLFAALVAATWRRFGDLLVDFPRELYHAWLVAKGAKPYLDFEHPHGAWALLWDGIVFRLFGAHSDVLLASNALLAALLCLGIYELVRLGWGGMTAGLTLLLCQVAFIFGGFLEAQIFNFIAPYNQSSLHAMVLAVWGLCALAGLARSCEQASNVGTDASPRHQPAPAVGLASHGASERTCGDSSGAVIFPPRRRRTFLFMVAGLVFGAICFTRTDVALAYCITALVAMVYFGYHEKASRQWGRDILLFFTAALCVALSFASYFLLSLPSNLFFRAMLGPWAAVSRETATTSRQLRHFGFDAPLYNFGRMILWTTLLALCWAVVRAWARWCQRAMKTSPSTRRTLAFLSFLVFVLPLAPLLAAWDLWTNVLWFRLPCTLPILALGLASASLRELWRDIHTPIGIASPAFTRCLWACFALLMLLRMPLNARVYQYGFYQALPATALIFAWLSSTWILRLPSTSGPKLPRDIGALLTSSAAAGLYVAFVVTAALTLYANMRDRTRLVCLPGLCIYTPASPAKARITDLLLRGLARMDELTSRGATFAAVPEGTLFHYVLRRPNPTPFDHLATVEVSAFGERRIVAAYRKAAPDFVCLIHKYTPDVPLFGTTPAFGKAFMEWLACEYRCIERLGDRPFSAIDSHGIEIYARNDLTAH